MKLKILLISLGILYTIEASSQGHQRLINNPEKETYKWFDSITGQKNSALNLGSKYFEKTRTIGNNHKYYSSQRFLTGNITYNNQPYFDVKMKYDIHLDQIIIQVINKLEKYTLQLEKSKIQSFSIINKKFVNISNKNNSYGFVEELKEGQINLYKKHFKRRYKKLGKRFKYSDFKKAPFYLVSYKNRFLEIRNNDDLTKLFPSIKKEINQLYDELNSFQNKDVFIINLITKIELLISNKM